MGLIASMTGYGRAEARGARLAVLVEVRSLNHRFLEIGVKLPRGFASHEPDLRRLVQGRLARGRVDVTVTARRIAGSASVVRTDVALGADYLAGARALAAKLGLAGDLAVSDLVRLPGVLSLEEGEPEEAETGPLLKDATEQALDELVRMRQAEGAALAADLAAHLGTLKGWAEGLGRLLPAALERTEARVRARIRDLLGEAPVDPARVAQEAAVWATRSDVAEELARLGSHCRQLGELLSTGGAVGRQLDFLAQEMHREVNTIASKADDGEIVARVVDGRTVVERLREQAQNVE
ncbi:MAG: YicC family protein [Candidatus Rokubacteria bacterium]|nr:YicC family protein [Candidatus Rokubacteria bacterium]